MSCLPVRDNVWETGFGPALEPYNLVGLYRSKSDMAFKSPASGGATLWFERPQSLSNAVGRKMTGVKFLFLPALGIHLAH